MNRHTSLSLILLAATGCAEYATVDEACDEKVPGGSFLLPDDYAGTLRINCYRKFSGVAKQHATQLVQQEAHQLVVAGVADRLVVEVAHLAGQGLREVLKAS